MTLALAYQAAVARVRRVRGLPAALPSAADVAMQAWTMGEATTPETVPEAGLELADVTTDRELRWTMATEMDPERTIRTAPLAVTSILDSLEDDLQRQLAHPAHTLSPGVYVQVYRGAIRDHAEVPARLDELANAGIAGIAWHGFVPELLGQAPRLVALASGHGLRSLMAFGLGDAHPDDAGTWIGRTALVPGVDGVVFDCEGAWEHAGDGTKATAMGQAFRAVAPQALAIDQPWPVPSVHHAFPWREFAQYIDVHAPQFYVNDWMRQYGDDRYKRCWPWFEGEWSKIEATLRPSRPRFPTIQGYGWHGIFMDLCRVVCERPTLLVWCEPWPAADVVLALRVRQAIGDPTPGSISRWQAAHGLQDDGDVGPLTLAALGLAPA